ncbi:MAG: hypothetical protein Q4P07_00700 [Ornithinimicrobium sp.]|uniref:hypothetical protein n=1 Tax=Ornithinimicrobium sp. TaxID=1977084 RepID=UPI0026DFE030|nr:hypothetical protein [Ornithinimicrobium sp.]MDO5738648.1 hypothetical protein [Ornithinimicrobium sp.]
MRNDLATASDLVWPAAVPPEVAVRTVARRLQPGVDLTARLYHHPFLGMMFLCGADTGRLRRRVTAGPILAAVVVDLVSGRAFLSDPWNKEDFTTRDVALRAVTAGSPEGTTVAVRGPAPRLTEAEAIEAGRALLPGLLARRRRLDRLGAARLAGPPVQFGKPNWWVTGRHGERHIEVVVDALSGRHYVSSA